MAVGHFPTAVQGFPLFSQTILILNFFPQLDLADACIRAGRGWRMGRTTLGRPDIYGGRAEGMSSNLYRRN